MYTDVTIDIFIMLFDKHKQEEGHNFSNAGLEKLFKHFERDHIDLDVGWLCDTYTQSSKQEALKIHDHKIIAQLNNETTVLIIDDDTIVYEKTRKSIEAENNRSKE